MGKLRKEVAKSYAQGHFRALRELARSIPPGTGRVEQMERKEESETSQRLREGK